MNFWEIRNLLNIILVDKTYTVFRCFMLHWAKLLSLSKIQANNVISRLTRIYQQFCCYMYYKICKAIVFLHPLKIYSLI